MAYSSEQQARRVLIGQVPVSISDPLWRLPHLSTVHSLETGYGSSPSQAVWTEKPGVSEAITGLAPCSFVPLSHMAPKTPRSQGAGRCELSRVLSKYCAVGRDDPLTLFQVFAWQRGLLEKGNEHVATPN